LANAIGFERASRALLGGVTRVTRKAAKGIAEVGIQARLIVRGSSTHLQVCPARDDTMWRDTL
jgi:hypothetical protein